jgi:hypothetical protein
MTHHVDPVAEGNPVLADDERLVAICSQACHDLIEPLGAAWRKTLAHKSAWDLLLASPSA